MNSAIQAVATGSSLSHPDIEVLQSDPCWEKVEQLASRLEFHCWGYSAAPSCYTQETMSVRISTYPREHIRTSIQHQLHPHGPVMSFALQHDQPALYKTVRQHTPLTRQVRAVLELNRQFAVTRGIVIPVKNVFGMVGLFALAFAGTDRQLAERWQEHGSQVVQQLNAMNEAILGRHARTFTRDFVPALPERQLHIIRLLARGFTSDHSVTIFRSPASVCGMPRAQLRNWKSGLPATVTG
jgi:hypothetical protein